MKIVVTIHHFPPNYSAGAEIYAFRLASWLVRHGHSVEVVCIESITHDGADEIDHTHAVYEGISVWRLYFNLRRASDPFLQSFDNPAIGAWFAAFLAREQPDVVHINSCYLLSASTIAATRQLSLPLIVTLHDFWFVCPRITLLKPNGALCQVPDNPAECAWCLATEKRRFRWLEMLPGDIVNAAAQRLLISPQTSKLLGIHPDADGIAHRRDMLMNALNQADMILSPSEFLRDVFIAQGIDPARIMYSRLGLDTSHWIQPPQIDHAPSRDLQITYIGQIAPHKGVHLLVAAFNRLKFSRRQARLKLYGDPAVFPNYAKSLWKIAKGNPAVEFAGRFDNRRIAEILDKTDVTVVPSIWYENSPISIMESLTLGTPVITANLGGMPELVQHNVNGLLFEAGNSADLARQLQRLLDYPNLATELAANAHPVRMIDDEMAHIISFYEQVIPVPANLT